MNRPNSGANQGNRGKQSPRLWIKLREAVSQTTPELWGKSVRHPGGEWIEVRGYVGYPGEVNHGQESKQWSFWESYDVDLSPIFDGAAVDRVYVEPGHEHAARLRDDPEAPFEVVVAEGLPADTSSPATARKGGEA